MADYKVTDTELTAVADAIRTKGGTSADLEWNNGFISAIEAISGGLGFTEITPYAENIHDGYLQREASNWYDAYEAAAFTNLYHLTETGTYIIVPLNAISNTFRSGLFTVDPITNPSTATSRYSRIGTNYTGSNLSESGVLVKSFNYDSSYPYLGVTFSTNRNPEGASCKVYKVL